MAPVYSNSASLRFSGKAPGSLILMGEYAVLHGHPALVASIQTYIQATLTPRDDDIIHIESSLGEFQQSINTINLDNLNNLNNLAIQKFSYVLTAIALCKKQYNKTISGFNLTIDSEFAANLGLGSSAAVTVAVLQALYAWLNPNYQKHDLFNSALAVVRQVQKRGSGADVAASVFGGILQYTAEPFHIAEIPHWPPTTILYSGHKTTTTDALAQLAQRNTENLNTAHELIEKLGQLSRLAIDLAWQQEWLLLGKHMNDAQKLLTALEVSTPAIDALIHELMSLPYIYGAKLSGAGLGDCVIGIGTKVAEHLPHLGIQLGKAHHD